MSLAELIKKGPVRRSATATVATATGGPLKSIASVATVATEIASQAPPSATIPVESVVEPASPTARFVYWEDEYGDWHGPVRPDYLGRTKIGIEEKFWVIVNYKGTIRWIWAELLRSRQAFSGRQCMGCEPG